MTEADWRACTDTHAMLAFLRGRASERRLRLFSAACCRGVWDTLTASERQAVRVAKRYADGAVKGSTLRNAMPLAESGCAMGAAFRPGLPTDQWVLFAQLTAAHCPAHLSSSDAAARDRLRTRQAAVLRDVTGPSPFRPVALDPAWLTSVAVSLARAAYTRRAFDCLPILADALQDAGCENADILDHCRSGDEHVRGCWVVDLVLGRA